MELLAVIVILAIILVIAVPKVMSIIGDAKKGTLESTAKMIASQAEKQKVQNQVLGNTTEITCDSVAKINDVDYESCNIEFEGNTAVVTIIGSGKFEGLNVCNGTKTNASGVNVNCSEVCGVNEEQKIYNYVEEVPYEVNDLTSCVSVITERLNLVGATDSVPMVEPICNGYEVEGADFDLIINYLIEQGIFTEEELIEGNVIKEIESEEIKVCVPKTNVNGVTHLNNLVKDENAKKAFGLSKDDTTDKNIRYVGKNPANKVYFNCSETDTNNIAYGEANYDYENSCEIWRIIGVFNVKSSENATPVQRIKIVRDEILDTEMEWDTSSDEIYEVNQWGETTLSSDNTIAYNGASLKQYLNDGNSSYYNSLTSIAKGQIEEVIWNTGAVEREEVITRLTAYNEERSNQTRTSTQVNYTTTWKGKIGLIYPSDYGYASNLCSDISSVSCGQNNWLKDYAKDYWTITPHASYSGDAWYVESNGYVYSDLVGNSYGVRPALYLSSNVQIIGGDGSTVPYKLK